MPDRQAVIIVTTPNLEDLMRVIEATKAVKIKGLGIQVFGELDSKSKD